MMTLVDDPSWWPQMMILIEDLAYVTLIDEDTKPILTDDANKEIPSNMTMHVAPPGGQISY